MVRAKSEMDIKLLPCPFCGDTYILPRYNRKYGKWKIGCNSLGCICLHTEGKLFDTKDEAINAWNRRVNDA